LRTINHRRATNNALLGEKGKIMEEYEKELVYLDDVIKAIDKLMMESNVRETDDPHSPIMIKWQDARKALLNLTLVRDNKKISADELSASAKALLEKKWKW